MDKEENNKISLLQKIEFPIILGKIDISKIDSSTRPIGISKTKLIKLKNKMERIRSFRDSGWAESFIQMKKNQKKK